MFEGQGGAVPVTYPPFFGTLPLEDGPPGALFEGASLRGAHITTRSGP